MIKKFIDRLLGKRAAKPEAAPPLPAVVLGRRTEVPASEHGIDPALLDDNAVRVVRTLNEAGHETYIVGGAVRDLLVGRRPKDFDVATSATPEQVKSLFRRAFIIGRRFRIVHVVFGRGREHEVIEVSTFRALMEAETAAPTAGNEKTSGRELAGKSHAVDAAGRVLRDNVWGPQIEDAARRDFTVNAMYYEPASQLLVDYHGGLGDVRARLLRMIGDPATRYREDPVRIIRIVRFAAKLGFAIDPATEAPIAKLGALLASVPPSRLFDEMIKLMQTGHALASIDALRRHGLDRGAFPVLDAALSRRPPGREEFVRLALQDTDLRVAEGRAVAPGFMLACMLWHDVDERWQLLRKAGEAPIPALQQAIDAVFEARIGDISGRGKLAGDMREIWLMQPRFERRTPSAAASLIELPRFRAGYDFLRLRADAGQASTELAEWWEDLHLGNDEEREAMLRELKPTARPRRGAAPQAGTDAAPAQAARAGDAAADGPAEDDADDDDEAAGTADGDAARPARKRRRRRRRGGRDAAAAGDTPAAAAGGEGAPGAKAAPGKP